MLWNETRSHFKGQNRVRTVFFKRKVWFHWVLFSSFPSFSARGHLLFALTFPVHVKLFSYPNQNISASLLYVHNYYQEGRCFLDPFGCIHSVFVSDLSKVSKWNLKPIVSKFYHWFLEFGEMMMTDGSLAWKILSHVTFNCCGVPSMFVHLRRWGPDGLTNILQKLKPKGCHWFIKHVFFRASRRWNRKGAIWSPGEISEIRKLNGERRRELPLMALLLMENPGNQSIGSNHEC